jgi:hypothetical protein
VWPIGSRYEEGDRAWAVDKQSALCPLFHQHVQLNEAPANILAICPFLASLKTLVPVAQVRAVPHNRALTVRSTLRCFRHSSHDSHTSVWILDAEYGTSDTKVVHHAFDCTV